MSNMPRLRRINPTSGQLCRPRHTWRGYRPSRSVKKNHLLEVAFKRARKASGWLKLPEQPDPTAPVVCDATGLILHPTEHDQVHPGGKCA